MNKTAFLSRRMGKPFLVFLCTLQYVSPCRDGPPSGHSESCLSSRHPSVYPVPLPTALLPVSIPDDPRGARKGDFTEDSRRRPRGPFFRIAGNVVTRRPLGHDSPSLSSCLPAARSAHLCSSTCFPSFLHRNTPLTSA